MPGMLFENSTVHSNCPSKFMIGTRFPSILFVLKHACSIGFNHGRDLSPQGYAARRPVAGIQSTATSCPSRSASLAIAALEKPPECAE